MSGGNAGYRRRSRRVLEKAIAELMPKTTKPGNKDIPPSGMQAGKSKARSWEIGIGFLCELLIFLYPFGAEQMNLPHNYWVGLFSWLFGTGIAIRIFWIFPWTAGIGRKLKASISAIIVILFVVFTWNPVREAYRKSFLEIRKGPLEEWQQVAILTTISQYPGHKVLILASIGEETAAYANQFRDLFSKAGWVVAGPNPAPINQVSFNVQVSIDSYVERHQGADEIRSTFDSARIRHRPVTHDPNIPRDWIVLWVGAKPLEDEPNHLPLQVPPDTFVARKTWLCRIFHFGCKTLLFEVR